MAVEEENDIFLQLQDETDAAMFKAVQEQGEGIWAGDEINYVSRYSNQ